MHATAKNILAAGLTTLLFACNQNGSENKSGKGNTQTDATVLANDRKQINTMLDSFNLAAANADYNGYFNYFTKDAVFIGTDATEYWNKEAYMIWAKPFFEKRTTWNFKSLDRHIYFAPAGNIAWFDELLNTQMKICRGSGVLIKQENDWKIQQYVLSMTIPNSQIDTIIKIKSPIEDVLITDLTKK